jgi:hypothetical protein
MSICPYDHITICSYVHMSIWTWQCPWTRPWTNELMVIWSYGHMDMWTHGHLDVWTIRRMAMWTYGHMDIIETERRCLGSLCRIYQNMGPSKPTVHGVSDNIFLILKERNHVSYMCSMEAYLLLQTRDNFLFGF